MAKSKDKIRVRFIGGNSEDVTGSAILIEVSNYKILLEFGLFQSNNIYEDYEINNRRLDFKPSEIDYIFLNHAHADHSLLVPRLYANGCKAKIITPKGATSLFEIMASDSAFIMSKDVEVISKKKKEPVAPIYIKDDVLESLKFFEEYPMDETIKLNDNISFRFTPSGHIINAAQLELWLSRNNQTKKILYTSDLGNISVPKHYANTFKPIEFANLVIAESTYGSPDKKSVTMKTREKDLEKIKAIVQNVCINDGHKVLIPIFALDRSQNILTCLYDIFGSYKDFNIPILIDSPLTIKLFNLYPSLLCGSELEKFTEVMAWENIKFINSYEESIEWQNKKEPAIILAASGFMTAGRSKQWAKVLLPKSREHILFVGYSSETSLAGRIKHGGEQKTVSIDGRPYANRCGITSLLSFTSHIQHDDMIDYYSGIRCEKIALVHGNFKGKIDFAKELREVISSRNNTSKVLAVNRSTEILL